MNLNPNEQDEVFQSAKPQLVIYSYTQQQSPRQYTNHPQHPKPKLMPILAAPYTLPLTLPPPCPAPQVGASLLAAPSHLFSKAFESGNLHSVKQLADGTYRLRISNDCNSQRHSQWFYFSCRGIKQARFEITGFVKSDSLYNYGMRVCVRENAAKWGRGGDQVEYVRDPKQGYVLRFRYTFRDTTNHTYFAYSFPYTYTDLQEFLQEIEKRKYIFYSCQSLTKSLLKNDIYCLTITNPNINSNKLIIAITARVHPGQSVSSHIVHGFINTILQDSSQANVLRDNYIFKIIPMINPDGVVLGNYRLSYSGNDLNRRWKGPSSRLHPQIHQVKKTLIQLHKSHGIRLLIDMHGHSRNKNVFFYGCKDPNTNTKQFPYLMSKVHPAFSFLNCCFAMQKSKQGTQRIAMNGCLKLPFVYTLESSFCGNQGTEVNYTIEDLNQIGSKLVNGLVIYLANEMKSRDQNSKIVSEVASRREELVRGLHENGMMEVGEQEDDGSSSAPSEGCYREEELLTLLKIKGHTKTNTVEKRRSLDSQANIRPATTLKKPINKSPQTEARMDESQSNIVNNSSLFDKIIRTKIIRNPNRPSIVGINSRDSKQLKDYKSMQRRREKQKQLTTTMQASRNKTPGIKRSKKYTQQLLSRNQRRQLDLQSYQFQIPAKSMNLRQRHISFIEPDILKVQEQKFNIKVVTPSFFPRHNKVIIYDQRRDKSSGFSNFQRSIKARDYLEEKKGGERSIVAAIRKRQESFL